MTEGGFMANDVAATGAVVVAGKVTVRNMSGTAGSDTARRAKP
ncbi:MAG: hypothetical protein ACYDGY_05315 [Acidimicrobiales bacterium]